MAFPTTLALITALWSGPQRTRSIALWSGIGGAIAALGPAISGGLLEIADWGWVFAVTIPLALIALLLAIRMIPAHVNENVKPVDNLGGALSMVVVVSVVLAINFLPVPNKTTLALALAGVALLGLAGFVIRQRRASNPLYDLRVASRPTFWVAAVAGVIVFGTLMGVAFSGQQYLQNVLDYSTLDAGLAILPAVVFMVLVAPRSAKIVDARGARFTLLLGYSFLFTAFVLMLLLWKEGTPYWQVALAFALVGIGIGLAGTPASHSLTGSVPVRRVGMASGTADLQRDLGGAIMQSILGALLTGGYASAASSAIAASPQSSQVSDNVQGELTKSFAGAEEIANQYPQYSESIIAAAKSAFLKGDELAYIVGGIAILLGAILVFFVFPKKAQEERLLSEYSAEDAGSGDPPGDQE
jgi:MFS transporter, DHA2 family, multidrug resistance protein